MPNATECPLSFVLAYSITCQLYSVEAAELVSACLWVLQQSQCLCAVEHRLVAHCSDWQYVCTLSLTSACHPDSPRCRWLVLADTLHFIPWQTIAKRHDVQARCPSSVSLVTPPGSWPLAPGGLPFKARRFLARPPQSFVLQPFLRLFSH